MTDRYLQIATTDNVKQLQGRWGSRSTYCRLESGPLTHHQLGPEEVAFIEAQDSFFLASINNLDWPYIQHRGGPPGFLKVLANNQLGFPDFKGNRQYIIPRFTEAQVRTVIDPLVKRIKALETELARLSSKP